MEFELALGRVNFFKNNLFFVNVYPNVINVVEDFLRYKLETFLFKYLGLLAEANLCLETIWESLVKIVSKRLHSLRHRYVSVGLNMRVKCSRSRIE